MSRRASEHLEGDLVSRRVALSAVAWSLLAVSACAGGTAVPEFWLAIARSAREQHPELDPDTAAAELGVGFDGDQLVSDDAATRERLAQRVRADFADGATIVVDGWVLARSEVLAAVLLAGAR